MITNRALGLIKHSVENNEFLLSNNEIDFIRDLINFYLDGKTDDIIKNYKNLKPEQIKTIAGFLVTN
jgi:hypothetical protein